MSKYKLMVWIIRSINIMVILLTVGLVFLPIRAYTNKTEIKTTLSILTDDLSSYAWLINHKKLNSINSIKNPDIMIINDGDAFSEEFLSNIKHEIVMYEHLFSTLDEIDYKQDLLTEATGITYSGYSGKTYSHLEKTSEIPANIISNFEKNTGKTWTFEGEGIIISKLDDVIVLQKGIDYTEPITLVTEDCNIKYWGEFEITEAVDMVNSIAKFQFHLTDEGELQFNNHQLPTQFTALYLTESPLYTSIYAAGDFSNYNIEVPYNHELLPLLLAHKWLYELNNQEQTYWQWYYPLLNNLLSEPSDYLADTSNSYNAFYIDGNSIYKTNTGEQLFIKGINLGAALPNMTFTEFPKNKSQYLDWFEKMVDMNVNTVRIYTLLPPVFYQALYEFNQSRDEPLYLLQEIWPEENPENGDYLAADYNDVYHQEIAYVVNAIHGNENITKRDYRAYGMYQYDVSSYLLGYLVGRELEPEEVSSTDALNVGYHFSGDYLYGNENASPTENWLASACDYTMQIASNYGSSPLVGIVNWPTLDPIDHFSEWDSTGSGIEPYNDREVVDINHIDVAGTENTFFFGAYHIYPNYPDFMNNDTAYNRYFDSEGRFRYGGYLNEFMKLQTKYPAIVAEYGISTSMYAAHINPDGYNHGGLDEIEQAKGIIRMTKAIYNEKYAGAIIFEWMDEWAKKTWTTEPYMIPYQNNPLWHNIMDPEQNYGILTYRSENDTEGDPIYLSSNDTTLSRIATGQDESAVYVYITCDPSSDLRDAFTLKISTPSEHDSDDYWEFVLNYRYDTTAPTADLLINPGYNWPTGHYRAVASDIDDFETYEQLVNNENITPDGTVTPAHYEQLGSLSIGDLTIPQNQISFADDMLIIRLPYGLLGISDPTTMQILSDDRIFVPDTQDQISTKTASQIKFELIADGDETDAAVYDFSLQLSPWEQSIIIPELKTSYELIADYFKNLQ